MCSDPFSGLGETKRSWFPIYITLMANSWRRREDRLSHSRWNHGLFANRFQLGLSGAGQLIELVPRHKQPSHRSLKWKVGSPKWIWQRWWCSRSAGKENNLLFAVIYLLFPKPPTIRPNPNKACGPSLISNHVQSKLRLKYFVGSGSERLSV